MVIWRHVNSVFEFVPAYTYTQTFREETNQHVYFVLLHLFCDFIGTFYVIHN